MKTMLLLPSLLIAAAMPFGGSSIPGSSTPGSNGGAPALPGDWNVDATHSSVVFRVKHANASWFMGTFDKIAGKLSLDDAKPEAGSVTLTIPVDSVDTNDKKRDDHLRGADFFSMAENPDITFASTKIAAKGDTLHVTGDLAMAGQSKSVTLEVEKVGEGEFFGLRRGYSTTFTIKRSDFGMTYGVDKNALGDEVTLMINLELVQAK